MPIFNFILLYHFRCKKTASTNSSFTYEQNNTTSFSQLRHKLKYYIPVCKKEACFHYLAETGRVTGSINHSVLKLHSDLIQRRYIFQSNFQFFQFLGSKCNPFSHLLMIL